MTPITFHSLHPFGGKGQGMGAFPYEILFNEPSSS